MQTKYVKIYKHASTKHIKDVLGAKMSYILVILMNLLELIALTLTSVMVFYYLRVCVCVWSLQSVTEMFYSHSGRISQLKVYFVVTVEMHLTKIYVCGGENAFEECVERFFSWFIFVYISYNRHISQLQ